MSIRIRHPDKSGFASQQSDVSMVMADALFASRASYTVLVLTLGVAYGSR